MKKDNQVPDTPTTQDISDVEEDNSPNTSREKLKSSNSSSNLSNTDEGSERNTSKKRRSSFGLTSLLQMHFPELESEAEDKKSQSTKKWKRSRASRKFSFASPEEYIQYSSKRNLVNPKDSEKKEPEEKEEQEKEEEIEIKVPDKNDRRDRASKEPTRKTNRVSREPTRKTDRASKEPTRKSKAANKHPSWARNWKRHQSSTRRFSFASPEEYLEYSSELKKQASELSSELVRAKKRNTNSTEFECLDATADISLFRDSSDANNNDEIESVDLEANNNAATTSRRNLNVNNQAEKESWFRRKLKLREVIQILGLWILIAVIALVVAREKPEANQVQNSTNDAGNNFSCLCPSGSSVQRPELEITFGDDFTTCASIDLPTPSSVYTCGELEMLLKESNSECSKDDDDICPGLKEAASQCCIAFSLDENAEKQLIQTESSVEHLYYASGEN